MEILTNYPVKDPTKVGQRFLYQCNEWHYLSQPEIDALGWPETAGFPAPVNKAIFGYSNVILLNGYSNVSFSGGTPTINSIYDILGLGSKCHEIKIFNPNSIQLATPKNFHLLKNLEDAGTTLAFNIMNTNTSKSIIESIFEQLPNTNKVATIKITNTPEANLVNISIATSKGYIVIL